MVPAREVLLAAARAAVQLTVVSLVITAIVESVGWTLAFVALMVAVASVAAGRRVAGEGLARWAVVPVAGASLPVVGLLLVLGVVPLEGVTLVPVAGILVGGAMVATSLAGRRTLEELATRHGEVEAGLAIGLLEREARREVAAPVARLALEPGLDQTRTVGLVTLPGAFVGMLLGGADPVEAGAVQLLVLVGLAAVQGVAAAITVELVARGLLHRRPHDG